MPLDLYENLRTLDQVNIHMTDMKRKPKQQRQIQNQNRQQKQQTKITVASVSQSKIEINIKTCYLVFEARKEKKAGELCGLLTR